MILYTMESFYWVVVLLITICVIDVLYLALIKPLFYKSKAIKLLKKHSFNNKKMIRIINNKKEGCDFSFQLDDTIYNVKVLLNPRNSDIQINNIETFISYVNAGSDNMKTKTLPKMSAFMNNKLDNKIILLPVKAKTIKKVINECEMIMVNPDVDVHGTKIYNLNQYENLFK